MSSSWGISLSICVLLFFMSGAGLLRAQENPIVGPSWDMSHGKLRVSDDRRFLVHEDGTPFLFLADTAWELFHRLTREDVEFFLEKRRAQGFTVIYAVALTEFSGLTRPNPYGHTPLIENDPARPDVKEGLDNDYWDHVDFIVNAAAKKGMYIGFVPTWGDKVLKKWGEGPEIFNERNAEAYGEFLGKRYAKTSNIIWILGGDRPAENLEKLWDAMARGIKRGDGGSHLMSYHPSGQSSSSHWFHNAAWLDFNMLQSSHWGKNMPNYRLIQEDYNRQPPKPTLDGEPRYDNHPIRGNESGIPEWFDDFDVRQAAYWALFAGAFGHAYGCHDVWQMYDGTPESKCTDPRTPWKQAVDLPGAWGMLHVRELLLSRPFLGRVPKQGLILGDNGGGLEHIQATLGKDGVYAFIYIPTGKPVDVNLTLLAGEKVKFSWFEPKTGKTAVGGIVEKAASRGFIPPGIPGRGNDWVLILDGIRE